MSRIRMGIGFQEALDILSKKSGRIYYIDEADTEIYEWDKQENIEDLENAEVIFAVLFE